MSYIKRRKAGKQGPTPQEIIADQKTLANWLTERVNTIVYTAGAALFILIMVLGIMWMRSEREEAANKALSMALVLYQNTIYQIPSEDPELDKMNLGQLLEGFDEVASGYADMAQGQSASLYKASVLYKLGRYTEAATAVEELRTRNPDLVSEVNGSYLLASSYEAMEEYNQAIGVYSQLRDRISGDMKAVLAIDIARCQEISGNKEAAVNLYREILSEYPDSVFGLRAVKKLATLGVIDKETL
ncbi:MAG: tetratricopeptide repeat protein [bacterium]|nr:tetratricopeptide repeat protein [bacterium]